MSRRRSSELEFGSDSFLDIIANIVGILIILIVVAGLRASRAPEVIAKAEEPQQREAVSPPATALPSEDSGSRLNNKVASKPKPAPFVQTPQEPIPQTPLPPVPTPLPEVDAKLPGRIAALEKDVNELRDLQAQFQRQLLAAKTEHKSVEHSLQRAAGGAKTKAKQRSDVSATLTAWRSAVEKNKQTLLAMQRQYDEAKRDGTNAKKIVHKLTAVGKSVHGNEFHFRVAGGHVARVPVKRLVEEMKKDVRRRKSWLMKFPLHRGTVGPLDGFKMNYVVRREAGSLNSGYGVVKLRLAGWKIETTSDQVGETADVALRTGSDFHRNLRFAESGTTLTFWVYPDSFALYRQLLHASRTAGFQVAARPLPFGMPIAGSPRGTRSSGQ